MLKVKEGSQVPFDSLGVVLREKHGDFKPYVIGLVWDGGNKLVLPRQAVVKSPFDKRATIATFLRKLNSIAPGHKLTPRKVSHAPVLVQEKTLVPVGCSTEYITLVVVGLRCGSLQLGVGCEYQLLDIGGIQSAILEQKGLPEYLWHIYSKALSELQRLMEESG